MPLEHLFANNRAWAAGVLRHDPEFFSRLGFTTANHQDLPDKIHKDCYQCPRLYRCDEIAMIRGTPPTFAILPPPKNWLKIQA